MQGITARRVPQGPRPDGRFWRPGGAAVRVKICGVKNADAALACASAGADAIGIHAVPAGSAVERMRDWSHWLAALPAELSVFLLTDTSDPALLARLAAWAACDTVQLQGAHEPAAVRCVGRVARALGCKLVRSVGMDGMSEQDVLAYASAIAGSADAILLDTSLAGGSGRTHDWRSSRRIAGRAPLPVILAGGLRPENVGAAIATVRPYGVDVESGVEHVLRTPSGGRVTATAFDKVSAFVEAARRPAASP
jgi:phosphoribosylanthranilate isomerase